MEHQPSLRELTVEGCRGSLVKGALEGMARRHGVEKLVVTPRAKSRPSHTSRSSEKEEMSAETVLQNLLILHVLFQMVPTYVVS